MIKISSLIAHQMLTIMLTFVSSTTTTTNILTTILKDNYFKSCELVYVTISENHEIKFPANSDTYAGLMSNSDIVKSTAGIFTIENSNQYRNKTDVIQYHRLKDIHRLNSDNCGIAVLYVSKVAPDLPQWLFDTLIPRYVPIIRKDEDHFLFIFDNEADSNKLLLSLEFGHKIKFKLGIISPLSQQEEFTQPILKQVDVFGEEGQCRIVTLQNIPVSGVHSLFIDKSNFHGKLFRVVSPKAPSYFEMVRQPDSKTYRPIRGLYAVWLKVMKERFNFTVHLTMSSASGSTGKRLKNGTWVGSVGDILAGRADMASFNGHIYNRHPYVDWSAPLTYEWMVFITHKPKTFYSPSALYRAFPSIMWIGIIMSVGAICLVMKIIAKILNERLTFGDTISYTFASFFEEGADMYLEPLHLSSVRISITSWLLFVLVISTAYRGKLVSLIAFPALSWVPTTFDDLAYSDYRVGLNVFGKGGATYSVLSTSKSPVYQTFFKRMELYPDPVKCLKAAFHNDLGCLMVKSVADFFGSKNFTDKFGRNPFHTSEQTALFREDGYIWEKRAIFRKHFDKVTWSMMESGLSSLWFQEDLEIVKKKRLDWESQNPGVNSELKISTGTDEPDKLQVAHLIGLFYVFICGQVIAGFRLIFEGLQSWNYKRKRKVRVFQTSDGESIISNTLAFTMIRCRILLFRKLHKFKSNLHTEV